MFIHKIKFIRSVLPELNVVIAGVVFDYVTYVLCIHHRYRILKSIGCAIESDLKFKSDNDLNTYLFFF